MYTVTLGINPQTPGYQCCLPLYIYSLCYFPVIFLQMRMKSEEEIINMQQFSYTTKEPMPAATWYLRFNTKPPTCSLFYL